MKIMLYEYDLFARRLRGKGNKDVDELEKDFVQAIDGLYRKKLTKRNYKLSKVNQKIYLLGKEYYNKSHILFLKFGSAQYHMVRNVVNTDTLISIPAKRKSMKDGDEEITCMVIKFSDDRKSKIAACLLQSNSNGVSLTKILEYLNNEIGEYHKNIVKDTIRYGIGYKNIVSTDFLNALEKANRIKGVKLIIDSSETEATEFKMFSDKSDIRKEFGIVLKPAKRGMSIKSDTVKEFFKAYKNAGAIRRIYVDSNDTDGEPLSFDTDKMKQKEIVEIDETYTGEINIDDLKIAMIDRIKILERDENIK